VQYAPAQLREARGTERFRAFEQSWAEQRAYLDAAVSTLDGELAGEARERLAALAPAPPDLSAYERLDASLDGPALDLRALAAAAGRALELPGALDVALGYQSFSEADYARFRRRYNVNKRATRDWAIPDYTKPGIDASGAASRWWRPRVVGVYRRDDAGVVRALADLALPDEAAERLGCPRRATLELALPHDGREAVLELQWFGKQASRLPEALWLSVAPAWATMGGWRMLKLGTWISPLEVVRDGNRRLHAAQALEHADDRGRLRLELLDAALVAPGTPGLLDFSNRQPAGGAMHVNLYNNVWGTNFPMWYEEDARFRFLLRLEGAGAAP
jgi:hypothetical protein